MIKAMLCLKAIFHPFSFINKDSSIPHLIIRLILCVVLCRLTFVTKGKDTDATGLAEAGKKRASSSTGKEEGG